MATTPKNYDVADLSLADAGQARIEWADAQMPVLRSIRDRFAAERPLDGLTVADDPAFLTILQAEPNLPDYLAPALAAAYAPAGAPV